jgi:thymidylate synthase
MRENNFTNIYLQLLTNLVEKRDECFISAPRGFPVREHLNVSFTLTDPKNFVIDFSRTSLPERQEVYDKYRKAELEWYLSGNLRADSAPSKFWSRLQNEDGTITSNYDHMMLFDRVYPSERFVIETGPYSGVLKVVIDTEKMQTPFERVVQTLLKDPDSRQAIVHYNQPKHCYLTNKDFPCTMYSQFFIREGKLHMTTYQRSCDIIKGLSYDAIWSCEFMEIVLKKLQENGMKITLGSFTHIIGSLHLYEKDLKMAQKIIENKAVQ